MPNIRQTMFPYAIQRCEDGTWIFLNRKYKQVGITADEHVDYNDPRHKLSVKLSAAKLKKLDHKGEGTGDRIFLYDDGSNPEKSTANLNAYLAKLALLIQNK